MSEKSKTKILLPIFIVLLCICIGGTCIKEKKRKTALYNNLVSSIQNKDWNNAKSNLDELGDYKNALSYANEVNYEYFVKNGDESFTGKNYNIALDYYNKAQNIKKDNKNLQVKIDKTKTQIKIQEEEEKRKIKLEQERREKERKAAIQKREQEERQRRQQEQRELADLDRLVKRAFVSVNIQDYGNETGGVYNFYIYPEAWFNLSYDEKKNIMVACRKYIQLKEGVSERKAEVGVRILNTYNGEELGSAISIK